MYYKQSTTFDKDSPTQIAREMYGYWQLQDYDGLVKGYSKQFYQALEQGQIWDAMSLLHDLELLIDESLFPKYAKSLTILRGVSMLFRTVNEDLQRQFVQDIPRAKMEKDYSLLCSYYQLLSFYYNQQKLYEDSVKCAKMSVLFANLAKQSYDGTSAHFHLVISYLNNQQTKQARHILESMTIDDSNQIDCVIQEVCYASILLQEGDVAAGLALYKKLLPILEQSSAIPYNIYLGEHIALQLVKLQALDLSEKSMLLQYLNNTILRFRNSYEDTIASFHHLTYSDSIPYFVEAGEQFFKATAADESVCCTFVQLKADDLIAPVDLLHYISLFKARIEVATIDYVGNDYLFMSLDETSFIIVTRYPYIEQRQTEEWFLQMGTALNEELEMNVPVEDMIVELATNTNEQANDFLSLYSQLLAKVYNKLT